MAGGVPAGEPGCRRRAGDSAERDLPAVPENDRLRLDLWEQRPGVAGAQDRPRAAGVCESYALVVRIAGGAVDTPRRGPQTALDPALHRRVSVLVDADMLKVVRTRRVRAIEERYYGRTARLFYVVELDPSDIDPPPWAHPLRDAMRESEDAYQADTIWANTRHVRISRDQARAFWARLEDVVTEFSTLPRDGDQVFGLTVALYPTDFPTLPTSLNGTP